MNLFILGSAVVIILCVFLNKFSMRFGIPMLLAFIVLGMLFGTDGILKIELDNYSFVADVCSVALIFIMFYGGFGTNYSTAKPIMIRAGLLATLGVAMGGEQSTFYGLTGLGDLIVTCASMHSRNRRAGILLGQGKTLDEAIKEVNMVVEGVYSAKSALMAARKYNVEIPIIEQVNAVLFENKNAAEAVNELMIRDKKLEIQSW